MYFHLLSVKIYVTHPLYEPFNVVSPLQLALFLLKFIIIPTSIPE